MELKVGGISNPLDDNSRSFKEREAELKAMAMIEENSFKRARQSAYSAWVQLNIDSTEELIWLATHHPHAQALLLFLFRHMDKYNAVMCSYKVMEEYFSLSRSTLHRAVEVLKRYGFVHILKSGSSNIYVISPDIVWSSWSNNRKYCKFPANIILSASENEEETATIKENRVTQVSID
jgi:hypothetical protein